MQHQTLARYIPMMITQTLNKEEWKSPAFNRFFLSAVRQMERIATSPSQFTQRLTGVTHFGSIYFFNVQNQMQTVMNMENTLQKHKSNMTPWTTTSFDYKLGSFNSKVRTVEDVKKNSHIGGNTPMSPKKFRQDKSLFTHINTSHHEMEEYLQRQGFVFEEEKERVTVSLKNSEKLNIKVTLDSNLDICHASYKAFRWFAANIISAKSETSSALDCVCYLTSKSMLSEDDYKELSKYKVIESIDNKVKVNPKFDSHVKFVRRIRTRKYTRIDKDTNLKVKAYLMKVEYSKQFKSLFPSQSHVEFKLKFPDPKPTSGYLQFFWKESLRFWTYFHHSF